MTKGLWSSSGPHRTTTGNLLDVDADLKAALGPDSAVARQALKVLVVALPPGPCDLKEIVNGRKASGALLLDGLITRRTEVASYSAVELIWPGDIITAFTGVTEAQPFVAPAISWTCEVPSRVALLPPTIGYALVCWPVLGRAVRERVEARHARLATIHLIAQVPRAEERLRLLLWLLAGRFGRVTADGIVLNVRLPYRTIGELIGARRPTLSLAMKSLRASGAVAVREDGALILREDPPAG